MVPRVRSFSLKFSNWAAPSFQITIKIFLVLFKLPFYFQKSFLSKEKFNSVCIVFDIFVSVNRLKFHLNASCLSKFFFSTELSIILKSSPGSDLQIKFYFVNFFFNIRSVSSSELPKLESLVKNISKEKQPFERLEVTKENLLKMFEVREK